MYKRKFSLHTSSKIISRHDLNARKTEFCKNEGSPCLNNSVFIKGQYHQFREVKTLVLGAHNNNPNHEGYQVVNSLFSKPSSTQKQTNGYCLRRAVSEVRPCMDLRQVRRGRKVFQIPRVIPPVKRQLFGVRQLLSICSSAALRSARVRTSISALSSRNRGNIHKVGEKVTQSKHETVPFSRTESSNKDVEKKEIPLNKRFKDKVLCVDQQSASSSGDFYRNFHTRTALLGGDTKVLSPSLSYSLGNEIKACSRSRARSIENKKRIYRTASSNRGSIRMAWWL